MYRAGETGGARGSQGGHGLPLFFKAKKKNNNRNKLKIHNITP